MWHHEVPGMNDRAYDEGVRDGIRSGNPGLRELSKQIVDLRAKLEAAEGRIKRAREKLLTRWVDGSVLTHKQMIDRALDTLAEAGQPTTEGGDASWTGQANRSATDPSTACSPAPSPTGGGAITSDEQERRNAWASAAAFSTQADRWQALAGELAEGLVGLAEMIDEYGQDVHGGSEPDESDPICHLWNAAEAIRADPTKISTYLYAEHGPPDDDKAQQAVIMAGHALARYHEAIAQHSEEPHG